MYAVIETGGKQHKISKGNKIRVEKLDAKKGDIIKLDVLMIENEGKILIGNDLKNSFVTAEVVAQGKDKKIVVYKYKAKKNERKKQGHRQPFTSIKINEIKA
jgi:large subunit ribosomal protein L21